MQSHPIFEKPEKPNRYRRSSLGGIPLVITKMEDKRKNEKTKDIYIEVPNPNPNPIMMT